MGQAEGDLRKVCPRCQRVQAVSVRVCDGCGRTFNTQFAPLEVTQVIRTGQDYARALPPAFPVPSANKFPTWGKVAIGLCALFVFFIVSNVADFMAQDEAAKQGYGLQLAQITGGSYAHWRANAEGFTYRVNRLGEYPSRVTIVGDDSGRAVRIGVVTLERTGPWHWQPTGITLDPPPYPDYSPDGTSTQ